VHELSNVLFYLSKSGFCCSLFSNVMSSYLFFGVVMSLIISAFKSNFGSSSLPVVFVCFFNMRFLFYFCFVVVLFACFCMLCFCFVYVLLFVCICYVFLFFPFLRVGRFVFVICIYFCKLVSLTLPVFEWGSFFSYL
jgi:hypothetical protein